MRSTCVRLLSQLPAFAYLRLYGCLQIKALLGVEGKQIGTVTERVMNWQLAHPKGTKDECLAFLRKAKVGA